MAYRFRSYFAENELSGDYWDCIMFFRKVPTSDELNFFLAKGFTFLCGRPTYSIETLCACPKYEKRALFPQCQATSIDSTLGDLLRNSSNILTCHRKAQPFGQ